MYKTSNFLNTKYDHFKKVIGSFRIKPELKSQSENKQGKVNRKRKSNLLGILKQITLKLFRGSNICDVCCPGKIIRRSSSRKRTFSHYT